MTAIINRQIEELEACFAEFRTTHANPCGGSVYYDDDQETSLPDDSGKPWRVHYADGAQDESFRAYESARIAIEAYVEDMRNEMER